MVLCNEGEGATSKKQKQKKNRSPQHDLSKRWTSLVDHLPWHLVGFLHLKEFPGWDASGVHLLVP